MLRRSKHVLNLECRPVHRGRPAHTQRMVQLPEVHPRTVRPIERSPRAQNPDTKSRGTRDNAVRLRHVEPTCVPLRHAAPSPPQVLDSLHPVGETTINCADDPISYLLDTLIKTGSESIEATIRRRRILFAGFVPRMEETRLPKCVMFGELELSGGKKKNGWGFSWTTSELSASTPTSGRLQPRTRGIGAERQNKGRNISWQNGSLQRKPGLWTTACSRTPERDGKDQGEDSPKQAG